MALTLVQGGMTSSPTLMTVNAGGTNPFPSSAGPTVVDFTGIPSWVKRITVMFNGVSTNGTSELQIQIGTSGGIQTTNYLGSWQSTTSAGTSLSNATSGFVLFSNGGGASFVRQGFLILSLIDSANGIWSGGGTIGLSDSGRISTIGGTKTLSGTLDRVRITTVNGTDTFDAGSINILYE
jgi:hypothetical protein